MDIFNFAIRNSILQNMSLLRHKYTVNPVFTCFDFSFIPIIPPCQNFNYAIDFPIFNFSTLTLPKIKLPELTPPKPFYTYNIHTPLPQFKYYTPYQHTQIKPKTELKDVSEPSLTDSEAVLSQKVNYPNTPKTRSADSFLNRSDYIAEEVKSGQYINKKKGLNIKDLKPYMKDALVDLDKKAKELGYTMVVTSGYRNHTQQVSLKRTKPNLAASPYKSAHEYGVAVDIALYKNGKKVKDIKKEVPEFGKYAQSIGLTWGAEWKNQYEPWHFNIKNWRELADIKPEYNRLNHLA